MRCWGILSCDWLDRLTGCRVPSRKKYNIIIPAFGDGVPVYWVVLCSVDSVEGVENIG
jgi:hypothetical protein